MDAEVRELERRFGADPADPVAVRALVQLHVRRGAWREAQGVCVRALEGDAPGEEIVGALRAAKAVLRAVPQGGMQALVAVIGGATHHVAELPLRAGPRAVVSGGVLISCGDFPPKDGVANPEPRDEVRDLLDDGAPKTTGEVVHAIELADGLPELPGYPVLLPGRMVGHCVARVEDALYVGGSRPDRTPELVAFRPLRGVQDRWKTVVFPPDAVGGGKAVDALLAVPGGRLIAVDDVIEPKFNFVLDVANPFAPRIVGRGSLRPDSTIVGASSNESWLALLAHGGRLSALCSVSLHDTARVRVRAFVSVEPVERGPRADLRPWKDVLIVADRLVIAAGAGGLLLLDLTRGLSGELDPSVLEPGPLTAADLAEGEAVMRLTPLPGAALLATIAQGGVPSRHVVVRLPARS